jgi:S1-C subfamily serine protease
MIDTLLLAATRIATFEHQRPLTHASGFFFARDQRLYLVTSRHVLIDVPSEHRPNRIEIELHTQGGNLAQSATVSLMLFANGQALWRQGQDAAGEVDVAVLPIDPLTLPVGAQYQAFTPAHLPGYNVSQPTQVALGASVLILGFPLGFHDTLHHLPVVRQSVVASAYGLRFQGQGYFLTDARTHRGTSGAPVVMRNPQAMPNEPLPWCLLGVHSGTLDMGERDLTKDESLGLNCTWYSDILMTLTQD